MDESTLHALLGKGSKHGASDVLLKVGQPPAFRVHGELHYLQSDKLTPGHTRALAKLVLDRTRHEVNLDELMQIDTSYSVPGIGRYRVNIFRQRGTLAMAMRMIPAHVPSFEDLKLPPALNLIAGFERGMVLVVGAAGNGKSSTLASVVGQLNSTKRVHIVTIEDPIEFLHEDNLASVSQREIGQDCESFALGLRAALRQDPDAILVGEIRDHETMDIALKAAETGHLVLSTLHTPDVQRTVGRVLALTEGDDVRTRLAENLRAVVAQRLLPRADGSGRVVAVEVLIVTPTARETIKRPENNVPLKDIMERGVHPYGMQTFEMAIKALVQAGLIDVPTAKAAMN